MSLQVNDFNHARHVLNLRAVAECDLLSPVTKDRVDTCRTMVAE
jgi:hypothetical protein